MRRALRDARGAAPLVWFYLATPLFAGLDALGWGPLRAAGIGDPTVRWIYYGGLFALGLLVRRRPGAAVPVALAEGTVNLTLLLLSVLGPIWGLLDDPGAADAVAAALPARVANLAVVGTAVVYALRRTAGRVGPSPRSGRP